MSNSRTKYTINELMGELIRSPNGIMVGLFPNKNACLMNHVVNAEIMRRNMMFISLDISENPETFAILQRNAITADPSNNNQYFRMPSILVFKKENMHLIPNEILDVF
jgi:hypothetical protein